MRIERILSDIDGRLVGKNGVVYAVAIMVRCRTINLKAVSSTVAAQLPSSVGVAVKGESLLVAVE